MKRQPFTENDWLLLRNILSLTEYMYRLGVYHGACNKDANAINEVVDRDDVFSKFRFVNISDPDRDLSVNSYIDRLVVFCGTINAVHLRNFLRSSIFAGRLKTGILALTQLYYRNGLKDGENLERDVAKKFLDDVGRGCVHMNAITKKIRPLGIYFDELKNNVNIIHEMRKDKSIQSSVNRLSLFMGQVWAENYCK